VEWGFGRLTDQLNGDILRKNAPESTSVEQGLNSAFMPYNGAQDLLH
jgi:hypothetical protein